MGDQQRMVLLPFGRTWSDELAPERQAAFRNKIDQFIAVCGGSPQRCIEQPHASLDKFIQRNNRYVAPVLDTGDRIVVFLTNFREINEVFDRRWKIQKHWPALSELGLWILYDEILGRKKLSIILDSLGDLDNEDLDQSPIWSVGGRDKRYLILTPECTDLEYLQFQIKRYWT